MTQLDATSVGSGLTLLAAVVVWLVPVLLAALVTAVSDAVRALAKTCAPRTDGGEGPSAAPGPTGLPHARLG